MTVALFGHSKLTDLAICQLKKAKEQNFAIFVTQSYAKQEYEILKKDNLLRFSCESFFIGSIGYKAMHLKEGIYKFIKHLEDDPQLPIQFLELIEAHANIPAYVDWRRGAGNWIMDGATIQPNTYIGNANTIWSNALVCHNAHLEDFNWLSPGAILCGETTLGSSNFIGAGSIISSGVKIGSHNIICSGALLSKSIGDNLMVRPGHNNIIKPDDIDKAWKSLK